MNDSRPRIILNLEGVLLDAYMSASYELQDCGKAARFPGKNQRLNDEAFKCILSGLERATNNTIKYPHRKSKEYHALYDLIEYMKIEYEAQRGNKIDL